ncbi:MAG: hypothetical protein IIZ33_09580, partial [Erysipelotrichaceae bacterium]|nr:hypothetical protein [Erysipelotrichaceae bacterium]
MKKQSKFLALLLAVSLFFSSFLGAHAIHAEENIVTYTSADEICDLVYDGYNKGTLGPITITRGTLKKGYSTKSVYLVTLSGTEWVFNQSTEALTDLFSGFNLKSAYYYNVV